MKNAHYCSEYACLCPLTDDTIINLKDKLHRRNMQIKDLKKVIILVELWCKNSAEAMKQFDKSHPNYKIIQGQITIYNDTFEALQDFKHNPQNYNI